MSSRPGSAFAVVRWSKIGIALVLGCVLAAGVTREQLSAHWEHRDPKLSLAINPQNPEALTTLAKALYDDHLAAAASLSRRTIVLDPLSDSAPRILAADATEKNKTDLAFAMLNYAEQAGWRDLDTQYMIVDSSIPLQDWNEVARHTDAILRMHPIQGHKLLPYVFEHCRTQACLIAFVARMSRSPPWRAEAIQAAAKKMDASQFFALLVRLRAAKAPITQDELASAVNTLTDHKQYAEAFQLWRSSAPGNLVSLDFKPEVLANSDQTPSDFAWRAHTGVGYDAELDDSDSKYPGGLLKLQFDGFSSEVFAERLLALAPGTYRLDMQAAVESGAPGDLSWKLTCVDGGADLVSVKLNTSAQSIDTGSPSAWARTATEFSVPPAGCPAQRLRLAGAAGDRKHDSEVWIRDLTITPASRRD